MTVDIRLLGPVEAAVDGEPLPLRGQKRLGLLAMLALREQAVPVATIAEQIWTGQPLAQATRSIRTYLSQFRREADVDFVLPDHAGTGYLLDPERCTTDVQQFRQRVEGAARPDISAAQCHVLARDALELWRGPALLEVRDQPWANGEIHALDELRRTAQHTLVRARLALGDHDALCGELEVFVTEHPFDEAFWADLMLAQYRSGRQTAALRTFQRARSVLIEELSLEPGPELAQLEAAIFRHDPALLLDASAPVSASQPPSRGGGATPVKSDTDWVTGQPFPLVGRHRSRAVLAAAIAGPDAPPLTLIEAEPGVGKSRMLALVPELCDDDDLILFGRASDRSRPFGLWLRIVRALLPHSEVDDPAHLEQLQQLVGGDTTDRLAGSSATPHPALVALLRGAALGRRLVVVLDDLHDADPASLAFLQSLLGRRDLDTVVVAASRPVSSSRNTALASLLAEADSDTVARLDLQPLDVDAVRDLARGRGLDDTTVDALWAATAGNALLVTESLLDTHRRSEPALGVPRTVQERTLARLGGYDEAARRLAEMASLLGDPFDAMLAGEAADLSPSATGAAVDALVDDYLVEAVDDDPGLFEYTHPLLGETVRSLVPPGTLPIAHRAIAEALERRVERGVPVDASTLGHHWASAGRAGDLDRAVTWLSRAATESRRRYGYDIAAVHLRAALELLDRQGGDPVTRARLHLELAETENAAGDINAAKAACIEAADAARSTDQPELLADAALRYGGELPMAEDVADEQILALLAEADARVLDPPRRALIKARLAQVEYWLAPKATRVSWCEEAAEIARTEGDPALQARVGIAAFWALNAPDEANRRLQILSELDEAVTKLGDLEVLLAVGKCRLHLLLELGDLETATALSARHARLAERLGYSEYRRLALNFGATVAGLAEDYREAYRLSEEALELQTSHGKWFQARVAHEFQVLPWRRAQGDLAESARWWHRVAEQDPDRPMWRALSMWLAAERDDLDEAIAHLDLLDVERFVAAEPRLEYLPVLTLVADTVAAIGDATLARVIYDALSPHQARNAFTGQTTFWGAVSYHLGRMALVLGDIDDARELLDDARLRHDRMGAVDMARRTLAALAEADLRAG